MNRFILPYKTATDKGSHDTLITSPLKLNAPTELPDGVVEALAHCDTEQGMTIHGLHPKHYDELKASGLSDAIIERYFSSIDGQAAQEWLIGDALEKLGGHSQQYATAPVRHLLNQSEHVQDGGWICSANGQIKPDQPRIKHKQQDDGSYTPVLDENTADGFARIKYEAVREKPYQGAHVEIMEPVGTPVSPIPVVNEGGKKGGSTASLGYRSIGLPGVEMGLYRDDNDNVCLIPALAELAATGATIAIAFDQDGQKRKRRGVAGALARLAERLIQQGAQVMVVVWHHQNGKGIDDILMAKGAEFVHDAIASALPFAQWKASLPKTWFKAARPAGYALELKRIEALHAKLNAMPIADVTLNQRYLDKGELPPPGSAVLLASITNTAKTSNHLAGLIEQQRQRHPEAIGISSAYRNILLRQSGAALGFTHWLDTDGDPSLAKFGYLAACPESLPKLAHQKIPAGSILLIDEVVAWLRHIFTSDTMKNGADRVAVLMAVKTLLEKIIRGGGYVVGVEAGIPQWAVDCIRELLPQGTPLSFVRNEFERKTDQKAFFYNNLTSFKAEQEAMVVKGVRMIAASDSATQVDRQYRPLFDTPKDFHISAENSSEEDAQRFAANPQAELIARDGLRFFSFSPTIGAGVSVDDAPGRDPWFDVKTGLFTHLTSADALQQMARYRREVPMHIYCQASGKGIGDKDLSIFDPDSLRARYHDDAKYCHELVDFAAYLAQESDESLIKTLERSLSGDLPDVALIDQWRSTIEAIDNFDKLHLKKNLQAQLEAEGYEIVEMACEPIPGQTAAYKAIRAASEADSGVEFAALVVPDMMTPDEARDILSTHGHSRKESLQARKCLYQFEFPNCDFDNAEFCTQWLIQNKGKKLAQLRAEWAARNPKKAKAIDRWGLKRKLKQADNLNTGVSMADTAKMSPAADVFAQAKLPEAIDIVGREIYDSSHPELRRILQWADDNKRLLESVLRMQFNEDRSGVDIFNSLVRKLGYAPEYMGQKGSRGHREKQYRLSDFGDPDRAQMLQSLSDKFAAKLEQQGETLDGLNLNDSPDWGISTEELTERGQYQPQKHQSEPVQPVAKLYATDIPGDLLALLFQEDLINAQTLDDLVAAKQNTPEASRRRAMRLWEQDGRYEALAVKAAQLTSAAAVTT